MNEGLIRRAQTGDLTAIGELYDAHREGVFRYLYYQVGDVHAAEDLTAEVFENMIRALPRYQQQGVPFAAWLYRIARNSAVDHFRKANMGKVTDLDENVVAGGSSPEAAAEQLLTSSRLAEALQKLNKNQRDVIILRFVIEMPIAEVARVLGKREDAIKGLQRRGLMALRGILADWNVAYDEP
jgi:RNA polymerase sigma-70 factor, ECF subfamily